VLFRSQAVLAVKTYDDADEESLFASTHYFVDTASTPGRLALRTHANWPVPAREHHGISIAYRAGYGAAADIPAPLRQGMLMHCALLYENRGDGFDTVAQAQALKQLPEGVAALYAPYRLTHLLLP
jgi:uncharacterized phiE125 gp8 family phage protein